MAKEVTGFIKLQIKGGAANPSPPVGPALGSKGLNIMDFCKQFNARTQESAGKVLPVVITVYSDKSFSFEVKQPPVAVQLKEAAKISTGSAEPNRKKVGTVTWEQVKAFLAENTGLFGELAVTAEEETVLHTAFEQMMRQQASLKTLYAEVPLLVGAGEIAGFDLRTLKRRDIPYLRRRIGIVFQDYQLLTDRNVFMNLYYVLKATGWKKEEEIRERIDKVLRMVKLEQKSYKMPFELSGGEQQRLTIARALLNHPRLILADEPTGNLDPLTAEGIMELFHKIAQSGCAVVMSTHNISLIEQYPSRTILFAQGHISEVDVQSLVASTK